MTSVHEPVLHALSVEPRFARPGETVSVIFRTRNLGTAASPPATVAFLLGDGFEVLGESEVAVESVAPGGDVVATLRARVITPLDDRTELMVQAALHVPDAVLGTNVSTVLVRSRAVLDGAESGTFVEPIDAERVFVRAVVTNEGDGAARDVRVVVPPPTGCVRADGDGPAILEMERLEVGASVTVAFEARIVEPVAVLEADDGHVQFGAGRCCTLPVRAVVVMEPVIAEPVVVVRPSRRSVDVAIDVRNAGWVEARDVRARINVPAPLRIVDGSVVVDDVPVAVRGKRGAGDPAFARVERAGGAHVVVFAVPARSTARVALTAAFPGGCVGGTIVVSAGAHDVAVPFLPATVHDVRMRLIETPRSVAPGGEVRVLAELVNAGDLSEVLFFCIAGPGIVVAPEAVARTIAPGSVAVVDLAVCALPTAACNGPLTLSVVACDTERERARADFTVAVRERVASFGADPVDADERGVRAVVHAALHGPDAVQAGAPFAVRLVLDVEDDVDMLAVRLNEVAGASYVPGSASVDGRSLLDRAGAPPFAGHGLLLRGIPGGTRIDAACTLLADPAICDEALIVEVVFVVDGEERPCAPVAVHVRGRDAFAAQPAGLPYHLDACIVESAHTIEAARTEAARTAAAPAESMTLRDGALTTEMFEAPLPAHIAETGDDAFTFVLRLDDRRLDDIARLVHGATGAGLVTHALVLRALCADEETSGDRDLASSLGDMRGALCHVFDRLFVKLRIPGFDVTADDLDDIALRRAMTAFFERLFLAPPGAPHSDGASVRITRERARELLAALAGAPYGDPAVLRALVALLPTRCEADPLLGAALARYACAFDDALARYDGVPLELFDDALARASDRALDDARSALAVALRGRIALTEAAC